MTDALTIKEKNKKWEEIATKFNAQSLTNRDSTSLKLKYDNIKRQLKNKLSSTKLNYKGTGGGPPVDVKFLWYEEQILSTLKLGIEGLPSAGDCDELENNLGIYLRS